MAMSRFPHSQSIVLVGDLSLPIYGKEAKVEYVIAHNGQQEDPILIVSCEGKAYSTAASMVLVLDGLMVS